MRRGYEPRMLLDPKGRMFAFATGSDATTEHEGGSEVLMSTLAGRAALSASAVASSLRGKRAGELSPAEIKSMMGEVPDIMERKRIRINLEALAYEERVLEGVPNAALTFNARGYPARPFDDVELRFTGYPVPRDVAGAWDSHSFGFRVSGLKNVARLKAFAAELRAGNGIFAGTFLEHGDSRLSGVIIAVESLLRPEHRAAMKKAQEKYTSDVLLNLRARTAELNKASCQLKGKSITHIWPVWKDGEVGGTVAYAVNPGFNVDLPYFGPYEFEPLKAWLEGNAAGQLSPHRAVSA